MSCELALSVALSFAQAVQLGLRWRPVEDQRRHGALDLLAADFDESSAVVKRLRLLAHCMLPTTCCADDATAAPATWR